jgi:hypothetical protein
MMNRFSTSIILAAIILLSPAALAQHSKSSRAQIARILLERAVNALKVNRIEALSKFNMGEDGFKVKGFSLFCASPEGKIIAHSDRARLGQHITAFRDRTGRPFGKELMQTAVEGRITEVDYVLVRRAKCGRPTRVRGKVIPTGCPGIRISVPTKSLVTRIGDLVCGVEFPKENAQPRENQEQRR